MNWLIQRILWVAPPLLFGFVGLVLAVPAAGQPVLAQAADPGTSRALTTTATITSALTSTTAVTTTVTLTVATPPPAPTATPTPYVVTATPTAETVLMAATVAAQQTADAATTGTSTPTPSNQLVATNTPPPKVVTATATPENAATATSVALEATAIAFTTGTATPSANVLVATPTATLYYITPTPPAADLFAAATLSIQLTADATTTGTATPFPPNWKVASVRVLPFVGAPENGATATAVVREATAMAVTTGQPAGVLYWTATPKATPTQTLTPYVVTATPTPETVLAAATLAAQQTAAAATTGTSTPTPINQLLATKTPTPQVVTATATPANAATAAAVAQAATAAAFTTGTPTNQLLVATPTATVYYITPTPAAADLFAAATLSVQLTAAATTGTATPFPPNWKVASVRVLPFVGTPENEATATAVVLEATALAVTTGQPDGVLYWTATPKATTTPQPTPTPTGVTLPFGGITPTATPTATPPFPTALLGMILFQADIDGRAGAEAYAINGDGTNLVKLSSMEFYNRALVHETESLDGRYTLVVEKVADGSRQLVSIDNRRPTYHQQLTYFTDGEIFDPRWSPNRAWVVLTRQEGEQSALWLLARGEWPPARLSRGEAPLHRHASWSPDGQRLVYTVTAADQQQLWTMNPAGGEAARLAAVTFNAWAPIWVKAGIK